MTIDPSIAAPQLAPLGPGALCAASDLVWDLIVLLEQEVFEGGVVDASFVGIRGGSAANVAEGFSFAGGAGRFLGQVGADSLGTQMVDTLFKRRVEVRGAHRGRSAQLLSLVNPDGNRSFVVDTGDQNNLYPDDVESTWLDGAALLHISGYSFVRPQVSDTMQYLATKAHDQQLRVTLDPGSSNCILEFGLDNYRQALARTKPDVLFVNESEADALEISVEGPVDAMLASKPDGVGLVVVHRGASSTLAFDDRQWCEVPTSPVNDIVDTTGAGDAFAAGFIVAWQQGLDTTSAIDAGHALSRAIITIPGASLWGEPATDIRN
jgi:sugar/nucleoside kinase (ribokinase family)